MDIESHLSTSSGVWRPAAPASPSAIAALRDASPIDLPDSYLRLLAVSNGGEGDLAIQPGWVAFWPAEQVLDLNALYEIPSSLPGIIGFGSNGGGELFVFDSRGGGEPPILAVPFVPLDLDEAVPVAASFEEFLATMGREPAAV